MNPTNAPIRILLVESHPLTRIGIKTVVSEQADMEIVGEAFSGTEGVAQYHKSQPDITLFGLRTPDLCGVDAVKFIRAESPKANIIILADRAGDAEIRRSLENGACGFVLKDAPAEELIKAIRAVFRGKRYVSPEIAEVLTDNLGAEDLTPAERRVVELIVRGASNKEISAALSITENTVKTHLKNIFDKLNVDDRTQAA
ncbi:MAG TPA: response regulator transcription factor, partial [Pyrinomonadaceae bacterium]|nr:response regulator transcription factor [Pyrinomonadaceae bacterium]